MRIPVSRQVGGHKTATAPEFNREFTVSSAELSISGCP